MKSYQFKGEILKVYVRFVQFEGEILAVFMRSSAGIRHGQSGLVRQCYAHIGQHSECYDGMERRKRATPEQYQPLLNELKSIGYENIEVM